MERSSLGWLAIGVVALTPLVIVPLSACNGETATNAPVTPPPEAGDMEGGATTDTSPPGEQDSAVCTDCGDGGLSGLECVDLTSNREHCGACGMRCGSDTSCVASQCRCDPKGTGEPCTVTDSPTSDTCTLEGRCRPLVRASLYVTLQFAVGKTHVAAGATSGSIANIKSLAFFEKATGKVDGPTVSPNGAYGAARVPDVASDGSDDFAVGATLGLGETPMLFGCPNLVCTKIVEGAAVRATGSLTVSEGAANWMLDGAIQRCPLAGCNGVPETVATLPAEIGTAVAMAIDASGLYVLGASKIARWSGTEWVFLGDVGLPKPSRLRLTSDRMWFMKDKSLLSCPKTGCAGAPTVFTTAAFPITAFAVDGAGAYWTAGAKLSSCASGTTCAAPLEIYDLKSSPNVLELDATRVYAAGSQIYFLGR